MGYSEIIKLPNGKIINYRPDPLSSHLKERYHKDSQNSAAWERDYYQLKELKGQIPGILILGAGSVGSHLALLLASACDCNIFLIDYDQIEIKHTHRARTIYSPEQVGKEKVYAAREIIESHFPGSKVHPFPFNVMDLKDNVLVNLANQSQVVINAVDDPEAMLRINDLLYPLVETLYLALHTKAHTGHIILTIPFASACLRCCMDIDKPDQIQTLHSEPGLSLDIKNITNYCATIALEIIKSKLTGNPIERWDINKNIFYFVNKKQDISPDGPGIYLQTGQKREKCPVCNISNPMV